MLPPRVSALIPALRELVGQLSIRERMPQIEVAVGDEAVVLRVPPPAAAVTDEDQALLRGFADAHRVQVWLQPRGPDSAAPLPPAAGAGAVLRRCPSSACASRSCPTDFTQVNHAVNRLLVSRAVRLLDPQPGERVADLFCGLGNFSLPLATRGAQVIGFEGSTRAGRARAAERRGQRPRRPVRGRPICSSRTSAPYGRLRQAAARPAARGRDRAGRRRLPDDWPRRIVYVSCDPATLARDAGVLVHTKGFRLAAAGVVNMFPHTAHVESVALLER